MTEHSPSRRRSPRRCPDWETKRAEHERRDAELRPVNKTAVFDALAAAGITIVIVAFDGYGDSGQIENIEAKAGDDLVALPSGRGRDRVGRLGPGRARTHGDDRSRRHRAARLRLPREDP